MTSPSESFKLRPGRKVGQRYVVEATLGGGTEGEVYQIRELATGIRRAAKLYFPQGRRSVKVATRHAQKLEALRHCPIVLQYHHTEIVRVGSEQVTVLISDLAEGEQLEKWIHRHPRKRIQPYLALHVLYHLTRGLECVHEAGHYHADVHSQNILIQPRGIGFDLKLIDFYEWGVTTRAKQRQDIRDTVAVLHECLGGADQYQRHPPELRYVLSGMRRQLILKRFPTMRTLRQHLESFNWRTLV